MVSNEIFVGSGVIASYAPECKIFLGDNCAVSNSTANPANTITIDSEYRDGTFQTLSLVPNLYVGCQVEIIDEGDQTKKVMATIISNTTTTLTIGENASTITGETGCIVTIQGFGAPVPVFAPASGKTSILSDNWLGLVNTFTPPNVEVETGELNLVAGGSRNLGFQFTKGETVSGGSIEVSMNNPMWLYYTLGKVDATMTGTLVNLSASANTNAIAIDDSKGIIRNLNAGTSTQGYPDPTPIDGSVFANEYKQLHATNNIAYDFTEDNSGTLPSFSLDVSYSKGANRASGGDFSVQTVQASGTPEEQVYSRIFTGCQVNSLSINFEEGQEVKNTVELVTRRAFDAPRHYAPHRKITDVTAYTNYSENKIPYLFHDGTIEVYGQNFARVKTGSLSINNNITPQRFIGNYNNQLMSLHTAGQRTYEISLTLLITDTKVWDLLREGGENTSTLKLRFERSATDFVDLQFTDYVTRSVSVPYPDDKGPVEVEVMLSPRTLSSCTSDSRWSIFHLND